MTTTTIYPHPRYPTVYLTTDSAQMTIPTPWCPEDPGRALLDFFRSIPQEDRFDLKDDVTDPKTTRPLGPDPGHSSSPAAARAPGRQDRR